MSERGLGLVAGRPESAFTMHDLYMNMKVITHEEKGKRTRVSPEKQAPGSVT